MIKSKATPQQFVEAWARAHTQRADVTSVARNLGMAPSSVRARGRAYRKYGVNLPPLADSHQVITKSIVPELNDTITRITHIRGANQ